MSAKAKIVEQELEALFTTKCVEINVLRLIVSYTDPPVEAKRKDKIFTFDFSGVWEKKTVPVYFLYGDGSTYMKGVFRTRCRIDWRHCGECRRTRGQVWPQDHRIYYHDKVRFYACYSCKKVRVKFNSHDPLFGTFDPKHDALFED